MSEELDRSVLDTKDREQLHAIAGAMGVRAATRMKKADLIDAVLGAANGGSAEGEGEGEAATAAPKRVRSKRASEADDPMSELAAEEDAIAADGSGDEPDVAPRPRGHLRVGLLPSRTNSPSACLCPSKRRSRRPFL